MIPFPFSIRACTRLSGIRSPSSFGPTPPEPPIPWQLAHFVEKIVSPRYRSPSTIDPAFGVDGFARWSFARPKIPAESPARSMSGGPKFRARGRRRQAS